MTKDDLLTLQLELKYKILKELIKEIDRISKQKSINPGVPYSSILEDLVNVYREIS